MKRKPVHFTTLTDAQWKAFKTACVQAEKSMTTVLWEGAQMYLAAKPMQETKGLGYHTAALKEKEGREE